MSVATKTCTVCNKPLKGRIDKKFCDDNCRNAFNNQQNSETNTHVRNINNILKKNRKLLEDTIKKSSTEDTAKISKEKLLELGFSFKYFTNIYTNKKGMVYYFCYEYGYLPLDHDWYFLVKRKED